MNLKEEICKVLDSKKAHKIAVVDISHLSTVADTFIICSANSTTQVRSLADNVEVELKKLGIESIRSEGKSEGRWAVVDYGDIIVHVFQEDVRNLYSLEQLWSDGANVTYLDSND